MEKYEFTPEHRKKISEARRRQSPPFLGRRHTEASKAAESRSQRARWGYVDTRVRQAHEQGLHVAEIAKREGMRKAGVLRAFNRLGIEPVLPPSRDQLILNSYNRGLSQIRIAKELGFAPKTVRDTEHKLGITRSVAYRQKPS